MQCKYDLSCDIADNIAWCNLANYILMCSIYPSLCLSVYVSDDQLYLLFPLIYSCLISLCAHFHLSVCLSDSVCVCVHLLGACTCICPLGTIPIQSTLPNCLVFCVFHCVCVCVCVCVCPFVCLFVCLLHYSSSSLLLLSLCLPTGVCPCVSLLSLAPVFVCLFVFLSVSAWWLIVRLADCPFVCLPNCLLIYFAPYTSTNLHSFIIHSFVRSFIHPFIHPFVCSFIH